MNYTLQIDLGDGFGKTDAALDSLLSKLGKFENLMDNISMDKIIDESGYLKAGEKAAESFSKSFTKNSLKNFRSLMKFWDDAIKQGEKDTPKKTNLKDFFVGGITTLFNPFVGARMLSDALGKGSGGGIFGKAGAVGYGEIFLAVKSLSLAFNQLKKAVHETMEAYQNATKIYAKSLLSGLGIGFTVKRGMLADVLGVSETDAIKFGAAMSYLNPKLEWASNIISQTTKPLTAVGWELKIMQEDLRALFALIAAEAAPTVLAFVDAFDDMIKSFGDTSIIKTMVQDLSKAAAILVSVVGTVVGVVEGFVVGIHLFADSLTWVMEKIYNLIHALQDLGAESHAWATGIAKRIEAHFAGKSDEESKRIGEDARKRSINAYNADRQPDIDTSHAFDPTMGAIDTFQKTMDGFQKMSEALWNGGDKKSLDKVPSPQSFMKQLPASTWEKMGLTVAGGGNSTNDLIRKSNVYLQVIARAVANNPSRSGFQFGMNPSMSQP